MLDMNNIEEITDRCRVEDEPGGCWIWPGSKSVGYGLVLWRGKMKGTHVICYEHFVGPIPEGLELDHLCRHTDCCNPDHLEPVTGRVNTLRGVGPTAINARKTHCVNGHEFTEENTYLRPTGGRMCKACQKSMWKRNNDRRSEKLGRPRRSR